MVFIPAFAIKKKRILTKFLRLNATSPERAVTLEEVNIRVHGERILARLTEQGILKVCDQNKYYVDTNNYRR